MSIACGHCGGRHESVREVRECAQQPTSAEQDVAAIVREPMLMPDGMDDERSLGDPWEGATESDPGVWSPGPASYLDQRRTQDSWSQPQQGGFGGPTQDEIAAKHWEERLKGIEEGFYALSEDEIYRVVRSKAGRLYAKLMIGTQSGVIWEYAAGAITKLEPNMRMDLDAAKKYGQETGQCLVCGRTLTDPNSIEAGIGPVCASRF